MGEGQIAVHGRKERVAVDEYTIEHILPQNPNLSTAWKLALGPEWERVQKQWLHTLGNLTLTGYNAEYSDRAFTEKRDMTGGFKESPLKLNAGLGLLDAWNEAAIQERAGRLADQALAVWAAPELDAATLAAYQPESAPANGGYSIEDHPHLLSPGLREVFEAFRKEVLALDPCVSEEFMKLYVAYKAEWCRRPSDCALACRDQRPERAVQRHHEHQPCLRPARIGWSFAFVA